jgi:hypothetical protein
MTAIKHRHSDYCKITAEPPFKRVSYSTGMFRSNPAVIFAVGLVLSFLILPAAAAFANIDSPQGALDIAGIVPGKYTFMDNTKKTISPAEATVSSVKAIVGIMKQAVDVAAMLPDDKRPTLEGQHVSAPLTDMDIALKVASMTPKNEGGQPAGVGISRLMQGQDLLWPVDGYIYSAFNAARGKRKLHGAIDIVTKKNTPIAVTADGIVSVAADGGAKFKGYGKTVIIDHGDGVHTLYAHCSTILVKMGQRVKRGDFIATVGRTGRASTDHLHFEVRMAGKKLDPLKYLPSRPQMVKAKNWKSKKKS